MDARVGVEVHSGREYNRKVATILRICWKISLCVTHITYGSVSQLELHKIRPEPMINFITEFFFFLRKVAKIDLLQFLINYMYVNNIISITLH